MLPKPLRFPIGLSDFRSVRQDGFAYVDKTSLIDDVLAEGAQVLLVPRPRRFGKTLNLSMLRYFLEKRADDVRPLFAGLAVASSESAWTHFQRYPVTFMTFKDVKPGSWEDCLAGMANVLADACGAHRHLLAEGAMEARDFFSGGLCVARPAESVPPPPGARSSQCSGYSSEILGLRETSARAREVKSRVTTLRSRLYCRDGSRRPARLRPPSPSGGRAAEA